jgi:predicted MFS family arabinose efflux permease
MPVTVESSRTSLTSLQWTICAVAALGFAFDMYELLMLPLIVRPALMEIGGLTPGSAAFNDWVGIMFAVPAVCGGIFGLLGGYLTDRFGRRRVLVWSILLYAFSAFSAGYATSLPMLLVLRCATFVGVCVEFVAAVAWLAELFPDPKQRESVIGYTQAFSSLGGLMVTSAYYLAVTYADSLPAIHGHHSAWRYTLISGVIPAFPLIVIRPFLPESPMWEQQHRAGTLRRPDFKELFGPALGRTTIVATVMVACTYAASFGALQHVPRIVPGLEEVRPLDARVQEQTVSTVNFLQEFGMLVGRVLLAYFTIRILSRRKLLWMFQVPGLILMPLVFLFATESLGTLKAGVFLLGMFTLAQYSFWGNYLPRMYPTHLRGTGESFAANVGGRLVGTMAAPLTAQLASVMPGGTTSRQLALAAALVGTLAYTINFVWSWWLPEPKAEELPD